MLRPGLAYQADPDEVVTHLGDLPLLVRKKLLRRILGKATLDHLFYLEGLNTKQVQYHVVREAELRH